MLNFTTKLQLAQKLVKLLARRCLMPRALTRVGRGRVPSPWQPWQTKENEGPGSRSHWGHKIQKPEELTRMSGWEMQAERVLALETAKRLLLAVCSAAV